MSVRFSHACRRRLNGFAELLNDVFNHIWGTRNDLFDRSCGAGAGGDLLRVHRQIQRCAAQRIITPLGYGLLALGLVGTLLFATAYAGFIRLGWTLARSAHLDDRERSLVRVGLVVIVYISIMSMTVGLILHREILLYLGVVWGWFLVCYERVQRRSTEHVPELGDGGGA